MPAASGKYLGDDLVVEFTADLNHYEDGDEVENVEITSISFLCIPVPLSIFPPDVQLALKDLSKEVEFTVDDT